MNYKDLMKQKRYIYLNSIYEPEENSLIILVDRCKVNEQSEDLEIDENFTIEAYSIEVDEELPIIQLDFDSYVSYSVTNESFTVLDKYEKFEGNAFRIYKKSRFLKYVNKYTIANDIFPELQPIHYGICCLNHIIDVISYEEPIITEIKRKK